MIVLDASAALSGLLNDGTARKSMATEQLHAPHLIDSEIAGALRRRCAADTIRTADGWAVLDAWRRVAITRYPVHQLLDRVWQLRAHVSAYDAGYVALAEALDCQLVTADGRLARAPGVRCAITVVPR